ncbi:hypothetical protein ACFLU2_00915 [Chloroflexota bacterium]
MVRETDALTNNQPHHPLEPTLDHPHFICEKCEQILDLDECTQMEINDHLGPNSVLEVTHYDVTFFGLCHNCPEDMKR